MVAVATTETGPSLQAIIFELEGFRFHYDTEYYLTLLVATPQLYSDHGRSPTVNDNIHAISLAHVIHFTSEQAEYIS